MQIRLVIEARRYVTTAYLHQYVQPIAKPSAGSTKRVASKVMSLTKVRPYSH